MPPSLFRLAALLSLMGIGALAGLAWRAELPGAFSGALVWLALDTWRALRLTDWLQRLRNDPSAPPPRLDRLRGEAAERIQRLLRKQAREAAEHENRLRNLQLALQALPHGVVILDEASRIEWCNRTAREHFGLDERRDLAQFVTHLLRSPALVRSLAAQDFDEAVTLESPFSTVVRPQRLEVRFFPYGQGRLLMLSRDVTVIEQAEAMRRDFVANVSHEIRTPLTVLAGFVETLQTLPLGEEERQDYLGRMARQAARMKNLVDDLLTLSRIESGLPPDAREWTPVRVLLQRLEADARALSAHVSGAEPRHELAFAGLDTEAEIAGSASELQSAFFNLVSNALRHTPPGGRIVVGWTHPPEGGARFAVQDDGPGIAPEHLPRLTERFYRVDADRSRGGTGLGLAIVKHVAQRHDAALAIDSVPGQGARFSLSFPAFRIREGERGNPQQGPDVSGLPSGKGL
jgi:two-component system phosphate regulon sensor histidine kinase PhoR